MTVKSCEKLEKSRVALTIETSAEEFEAAVNKAYLKMRGKINVPGFRVGKAPRKIIEKMYGAEVFYEEAVNIILPDAYEAAVKEQELNVVGYPEVELESCTKDGVVFKCTVAIYPEVKLGQYKGLEAPKAEVKVAAADVNARLKEMADRNSRLVSVDRAVKKGDTADIDFEGFDNGKAFDGGKGENFDLEIGSGSFVPGFEDQLIGMKAGEEKDIDITFPENYHEDLAGKAVVFHVKVNKVTETIVPAQDDDFARDVSEFDSLEELKNDIRAKALNNAQKQIDNAFENACIEKAAENTTVDMPSALVDNELDVQMERFAYQLQMSGYSMDQYAKMMGGDVNSMRNAFRPAAEKQARITVTLNKIVEAENITVSDEEVEAEYADLAKQYELELDKVKSMVPAEEITDSLKSKKAIRIIVDSAKAVAPAAKEETKTEE